MNSKVIAGSAAGTGPSHHAGHIIADRIEAFDRHALAVRHPRTSVGPNSHGCSETAKVDLDCIIWSVFDWCQARNRFLRRISHETLVNRCPSLKIGIMSLSGVRVETRDGFAQRHGVDAVTAGKQLERFPSRQIALHEGVS